MKHVELSVVTDEFILKVVELIDEVLKGVGASAIESNDDFVISERSHKSALEMLVKTSQRNGILFEIQISPGGVELRLDREFEAYQWSADSIISNPSEFSKVFRFFLVSYIVVEYYRTAVTVFRLFDAEGRFVLQSKVTSGIALPIVTDSRLYFPLYSLT